MRILHLLDPAVCGDEGLLACAAAMHPAPDGISPAPHITHDCWIIGNADDERRAWNLGIPSTDRVQSRPRALLRDPVALALKRLRAARYPRTDPDIVQCWSLDTLPLARRIFGSGSSSPARVAVIARIPSPDQPPLDTPDTDLATAREVLVALDPAARPALASLLPRDALDTPDRWLRAIRLIDPPAFPPHPPGGPIPIDRAALRESLGLEPTDAVISVLADPPNAADARRIAFAAGVILAAGNRVVTLMRRGAQNDRRAAAYVRSHGHRWGMVLADLSLPQLIAASDLCIVDSFPAPSAHPTLAPSLPTCGPVSLSLALSMAIPIAAFPGHFHGFPIAFSRSTSLGRIAVPITEILESPQLRTRIAAESRSWCDHARSRDGFRTTLSALWHEVSNMPAPNELAPALIS